MLSLFRKRAKSEAETERARTVAVAKRAIDVLSADDIRALAADALRRMQAEDAS